MSGRIDEVTQFIFFIWISYGCCVVTSSILPIILPIFLPNSKVAKENSHISSSTYSKIYRNRPSPQKAKNEDYRSIEQANLEQKPAQGHHAPKPLLKLMSQRPYISN
ncbi:hypothetical protein Dimus_034798 [Dionaea muscipula]